MTTSHSTPESGASARPFVCVHIGDLHLTHLGAGAEQALRDREAQLESDLAGILAQIDAIRPRTSVDFVYLPGDLAENGRGAEYDVLSAKLAAHPDLTVRLIPGDHDRQLGSMAEFATFRSRLDGRQKQADPITVVVAENPSADPNAPTTRHVTQYFYDEVHNGVRCLFLDLISAGYGQKGIGLDFRLGTPVTGHKSQFNWLTEEVERARRGGQPCAVFMHCYPEDMRGTEEAAAVAGLFWNGNVRLVEMGHTHYSELAPDGRTLYAAVRSTGQNEDGPTGFAFCAIDGPVTSWRFKQLQQTWPFVMITGPADHRLATEALAVDKQGRVTVRAMVFSDQAPLNLYCECCVDDGAWLPMCQTPHTGLFELPVAWSEGSRTISVKATDGRESGKDFVDVDTIEPPAGPKRFEPRTRPRKLGSDASSVPSWPEKGIRGDQLGPNKRGRKW